MSMSRLCVAVYRYCVTQVLVYTGNGTCSLIGTVPGDAGINIEHRWVQGPVGAAP